MTDFMGAILESLHPGPSFYQQLKEEEERRRAIEGAMPIRPLEQPTQMPPGMSQGPLSSGDTESWPTPGTRDPSQEAAIAAAFEQMKSSVQEPTITNIGTPGGGVELLGGDSESANRIGQLAGVPSEGSFNVSGGDLAGQTWQENAEEMNKAAIYSEIQRMLQPEVQKQDLEGGTGYSWRTNPQNAQIAGGLTKIMGDVGLNRGQMEIDKANQEALTGLRGAQEKYYEQGRQDPLEAQIELIIRNGMSGMGGIKGAALEPMMRKALAAQSALLNGDRKLAERLYAEISSVIGQQETFQPQPEQPPHGGLPPFGGAEKYRD